MLAARQHDPEQLVEAYRDIGSLVLTIDGLQPEKGHETLYVVRELMRKRVWFAEPLLSSATEEVRRLIVLARQWAERLDKPVRVWMSDKQDAFVTAIAEEFEGVPHRYCQNHFLRDVAQPVLDMDSRAKVKMRSTVRGLRAMVVYLHPAGNSVARKSGKIPPFHHWMRGVLPWYRICFSTSCCYWDSCGCASCCLGCGPTTAPHLA